MTDALQQFGVQQRAKFRCRTSSILLAMNMKRVKLIAHRIDLQAIAHLHRIARARRQTIAKTLNDAILSLS